MTTVFSSGCRMQPTRILFVLSSLKVGGIETWLTNVVKAFREFAGKSIECDFLTLISEKGYYRQVVEDIGCRTFHIQLDYRRIGNVIVDMAALMRRGRYDIVHCQSDYTSGSVMLAALVARVPFRLFHIHNMRSCFDSEAPMPYALGGKFLRGLAVKCSHCSLACSRDSRSRFFEGRWPQSARVLYCGIDTERFAKDPKQCRAALLAELQLSQDTILALCVGRIEKQKNLGLLVEVVKSLRNCGKVLLIHTGDGVGKELLTQRIKAEKLAKEFILLGRREDVPDLMLAADVFVIPSLYEGLPLVLLEAQAAGLPCVVSNAITRETVVIPQLFRWLSPKDPPSSWAEAIALAGREARPICRGEALQSVRKSQFSLEASARALLEVYNLGSVIGHVQ